MKRNYQDKANLILQVNAGYLPTDVQIFHARYKKGHALLIQVVFYILILII